jgi:hypothetical protein
VKICFRTKRFSSDSLTLLTQAQRIIDNYQSQNITMTLRQLYYQLVVANVIPNKVQFYNQLVSLITDARYAGLVDWDAIEDNLRKPRLPSTFTSISDLLNAAMHSYRLDFWKDMTTYVELYTEKDALSSILAPIAFRNRIVFQVNRGYSSASSMFEGANRFFEKQDEEKDLIILYLGDHDPSGLDMVRDIETRLREFGVHVTVRPLALTWDQIQKYSPPPNPAKMSDSRSENYVHKFGEFSWEVDSLPPDVMIKLVEDGIQSYLDPKILKKVMAQEQKDKKALQEFSDNYGKKK